MSGRFVRASKFRHVHGETPKPETCFQELRPQTTGESRYIACNRKYFAIGIQGGGGPLLVHPLSQPQRFPASFPVVNVHKGKILDMDFNPFYDDLLAMCSDDGTASMIRIPEEMKENVKEPLVHLTGHQKRIGCVRFNPSASGILSTGSYDCTVKTWDVEAQAELFSYNDFTDFIQCLAWKSDGSLLAVTSKDKTIRVVDPRQAEAAIKVAGYQGAKGSQAVWADNHNKLVVTGFSKETDRCVGLYDPRNMSERVENIELDQSAGVLLPFYDQDTSMLWLAGKGDGNIRYFEMEGDELHHLADWRSNTPHKGVVFAPKAAVDYMGCEVALCLRLLKNQVEPVHFVVPRKSDLFQADLYPETLSGTAVCTAQEWVGGASGVPKKIPIQEAAASAGAAVEFVAKKSPVELEKELTAALARIKELEEQIVKLTG